MSDISPSSIRVSPEIEAKLKTADFETIREILKSAAISQGLVAPDIYDSSVLIPLEQTALTPQQYAPRVETMAHLEREKNERGQFVSPEDISAKAELELKFKRGEIDASTYLAESGAIEEYLASRGVSMDDLRVAADPTASRWKAATDQFKELHPNWAGGQDALKEMTQSLERLGLVNSPSVESLCAAYADAQRRGALAKTPELEAEDTFNERVTNARDFSDIQRASSALFGR